MEVGLGSGHIVLDGDPSPSPKRGHSPQFSAHVYCAQTAGWIKMPLGMEVCLGPGGIVLHGDPALPSKGAHVCCGQTVAHIAATDEQLLTGAYGSLTDRGVDGVQLLQFCSHLHQNGN